jgi:hypothetical protein
VGRGEQLPRDEDLIHGETAEDAVAALGAKEKGCPGSLLGRSLGSEVEVVADLRLPEVSML